MPAFLTTIINIVLILLVLGVLITLHELGHLIAAKLLKVRVDAFAIGMGPKIFSRSRGETEYSLNALPIGGYVKIYGEGDDPDADPVALKSDPRSFQSKSPWVKTAILTAGVIMNLLTAVIIYYAFLIASDFKFLAPEEVGSYEPLFGRQQVEIISDLKYKSLSENGNAIKSEWPESGLITAVGLDANNLETIETSDQFSKFVKSHPGEEITVTVCENPKSTTVSGTENSCDNMPVKVSKDGLIGVLLARNYINVIEYTGTEKLLSGFLHSANMVHLAVTHTGNIFSEASETGNYDTAINTVSSPIGLYFIVDFLREIGILGILDLVANLSITLFIINLLPIPALDGGRVVLVWLEKLLGRHFRKGFEAWSIRISFIVLILFMVAVVVKDIVYFDKLQELFG